ncbi:Pyrimidine deaminase, riboflavin biosynthesis [Leptospira biflexa serovar Patoc strain 'Patoc 1 (Ames)']|uniref:Riboflavin biosynthesis protein RibD n=1 Tax=Leptospira biflexa serovar Patoc (strain Patoc 1 / ATCC 23582 / Paris) TaxID=456481 RepID=B0SPU6_LEPBP|nr:pyrimidine deaminase [Leptospira biflexa]ABZ93869.1 Pyrimidine deaminase, riboflavin biosynthesis [Leptospira biflexa serovar Patoc strain 'Patoc 1 (Ames)']ABZ97512.1 Riboflavin biosynthesis protein RibD [Leptospira biflexa serovar Patoc strain 'Patoc 1 (Paris)']
MDVEKRKELYSLHSLLGFLAMGKTGGNPPVSAVLTNSIGEPIEKAHTQGYGGNHAERELYSLVEQKHSHSQIQTDENSLSDTILSVSLEPCTHFGKTPPCRDLVLQHKPKELLLGWKDPNPMVQSGDWKLYLEQGTKVRLDPMLANTSLPYLQGFLKRMQTGKPWVWIKSATSTEGNYVSKSFTKERVSSIEMDLYLQLLRAKFDAVAVGPNTTKVDEPSLHFRITEEMIQSVAPCKRETELVPFFEAATNLFSSLCRWTKESVTIHQLEEERYQPYRVFVLDPNRMPSDHFFTKQRELNERLGKKLCLFFLLTNSIKKKDNLFGISSQMKETLESLSNTHLISVNQDEGDLFLKTLGKLGINTLLCEAGSFFPNFLKESFTDEDCTLEIRNHKKSIPDGIPFDFIHEPIVSEFRVGSNSVFFRKTNRRG